MQMAVQLQGSKSKSNTKHSEIKRERSWAAGKPADLCGAIASESVRGPGSKLAGKV